MDFSHSWILYVLRKSESLYVREIQEKRKPRDTGLCLYIDSMCVYAHNSYVCACVTPGNIIYCNFFVKH